MKRLPAALAAAAALLAAAPAAADALIDNVNGVTLDDRGAPLRFTGIVITREGRVVKLLQPNEKRPDRPDWRADLKGKTVLPGFVDAHGHLMELGFGALTLDLADTKSLDEALAKIAAYAAANPERKWILGRGWNQEAWGLGRFPTNADLDKAVRDRPVWLERADGHAAWANSAAMAAAGVDAKTATPAGGRIEKANGAPSGVFVDAAKALVERAVPKPLPKERALALEKAQLALLSVGVTATADMGTTLDDWQALRRAGDLGALRVRVMSYGAGLEDTLRIGVTGPTPWLYGGKLKLVGVKLYADGALGSRGAWLKAPYADATGQRGAGFYSDAQLKNLMSRAAMDGYQVAVHAIGDAANAQVLSAIEDLAQTYTGDRRWRIEHAQIVDPADLPRFGRNGVIASMQPIHQPSDRTMAEARLGPDRLAGAYAWATMLKVGGRLAFGTDYPVERPDPFAGWAAAFTRTDAAGAPYGGWQPQEKLSREAAWAAYTSGGAYAGFAEKEFGRLAPGMWADFIVVSGGDPLLLSPSELRAVKVEQSWVGGVMVWEGR
ncbi:MAG: metal-dependent hydrolase [Proteobacteria bacterium SG_bin6]|nr:MAG: metal-dependent hydrolase [Proteobacteria bacterium SG_bin6]